MQQSELKKVLSIRSLVELAGTHDVQTSEDQERVLHRDLSEYGRRRSTTGPYADNLDVDVLIVGAGFGGTFLLYEMRKAGYKTVLYEAGTSFGGTWRWNRYPGARVDSEVPVYELSIPEVWKEWTWSTNYPNYQELQQYFDHVDKVLDLSRDCAFETCVTGAEFDEQSGKWNVRTVDGRTAKAQFLIVAAGFAAKRYIPDFNTLEKFKGTMFHSSFWPTDGVDVRGKRCAVIGTGASGVQIAQEWGPIAGELKVFQRTPNLAIPMGKRDLSVEEQSRLKPFYPELYAYRETTFGGLCFDFSKKNTFDDSPSQRQEFYQQLWDHGGFAFWLGNYKDYLYDAKANREVYNFWAKKQRSRIHDPRKRDLLCPLEPPHPFGVKRPCLEQNFYEQFNRPNVDVVDISEASGNAIVEFTETGIKTADGSHHELDVIAIATGFDITTGGMTSMGLKSVKGTYLQDEWKKAAHTYLGTTVSGYPNMFHLYGPHGPTLLSNGPTSVEIQGRWIRDAINKINSQKLKFIDPTEEASMMWKNRINELSDISLFPTTKSTYMGGSLPGKAFEQVNYAGGMSKYKEEINAVLPDWKGFRTVAVGG
ncbi:FAD/NAD(P)-binding domain-containing protein [Viridothelium virens]|uniref:FAD/NAD(P)-binding domain-containing protein n=1 Tax=Viridothelium virens TaxID=1048519 RepID=A0A6A6H8C0_VIRVR|nr:FAD/NAD(P)-binding domain-containing protein [Viridothelium virens]